MSVAFVCTNFNNSDDTIALVKSLREGDSGQCPVLIIDNASARDQVGILKALAKDDELVTIAGMQQNVGYFRGLNIGLAQIREMYPDVDVVVAGNNDLLFPNDFLESLLAVRNRFETHAVLSPDIITVDGAHQNPHVINGISRGREIVFDLFHSNYTIAKAITFLTAKLGRIVERGDENQHANAMEITQGHGSCYLLGPRFFRDFGELWAPTFLFGEEFFLSLQLERKGQRIFYEPAVKVTHVWHASVGTLPSRKRWELGRAAHRIYREHNPIWRRKR